MVASMTPVLAPRVDNRRRSSCSLRSCAASRRTAHCQTASAASEALDFDFRLPAFDSATRFEIIPLAVARRRDAAQLELEVAGVGGGLQRLVARDQVVLVERHQRLIERLHAIRRVTLCDNLAQIARLLLVGNIFADAW